MVENERFGLVDMPGSVLKQSARRLIFSNSPKLLFVSLIYIVFLTVISWLSFRLPFGIIWQETFTRLSYGELPGFDVFYTGFRPVGLLLAIILSLVQPVLNVGFISYCLKTNRAQETEFKDLFNGFLFIIKIVTIYIITTILVFLWSMLLVIPGIVASYRYRQAYFILLDDPGKSALQCISESKLMMRGNKLELLTLDISFIGWFLLDFLVTTLSPFPFAFPIISVWLSPYLWLTRAAFYEHQIADIAV